MSKYNEFWQSLPYAKWGGDRFLSLLGRHSELLELRRDHGVFVSCNLENID